MVILSLYSVFKESVDLNSFFRTLTFLSLYTCLIYFGLRITLNIISSVIKFISKGRFDLEDSLYKIIENYNTRVLNRKISEYYSRPYNDKPELKPGQSLPGDKIKVEENIIFGFVKPFFNSDFIYKLILFLIILVGVKFISEFLLSLI